MDINTFKELLLNAHNREKRLLITRAIVVSLIFIVASILIYIYLSAAVLVFIEGIQAGFTSAEGETTPYLKYILFAFPLVMLLSLYYATADLRATFGRENSIDDFINR